MTNATNIELVQIQNMNMNTNTNTNMNTNTNNETNTNTNTGTNKHTNAYTFYKYIRRSVRSCSQTIPEKVRNSRPINMGFKGCG